MSRNPYRPPQAPLESAVTALPLPGFPFDLVRVVIGAALVGCSLLNIFWLCRSWADLADRAYIDTAYNPWRLILPYGAMLATGGLLLLRRRLVFVPFALYCAAIEWQTLSGGRWHYLPKLAFLTYGLQLAMLAFLLGLVARNRLR
jgi:hypothetical protein